MKSEAFESAYKRLNKEQKQAVDTTDGPVMVIAGPGTGKTTVLTLRIANILHKTDTPPDAILALTFTESGVYAMRKKLASLIGSTAYRVQITTFHGFANNLIQNNPGSFPRIIGARPATEIDQVRILESLIKRGKWKQVKPMGDVFYYVRPVLGAIRDLKKENYTPEKYKRWLATDESADEAEEAKKERNLELAKLYSLYEKELRDSKLYDYEDMLIEAVRVLEADTELLLTARENCQYILADEHQDSNGTQNKMLELLAGTSESRPNLFIVGDEKQAIYRFQGASLENFLYFKNRFPEAVSVVLAESYRSHQNLLDASHTVALSLPRSESVDRPRLLNTTHSLKSGATGPKVESISFPDEETEAAFIAKKIKEAGNKERIAVLYRNNNHSAPIAEALEKEGVEFVVRSDEDIFADSDIQNLITLFRALNNPTDDENVAKTMLVDFSSLDVVDCFKAFNTKRNRKIPLVSLLLDKKRLTEAGVQDPEPLMRFAGSLKARATRGRSVPLTEFIDEIASQSGFRDKLIASDRGLAKLEKLHSFYEVAKSLSLTNPACRLPDLMSHIDSAGRFGVRLGAGRALELPYGTELMTAHRAKGLEFDTVFITRTTDDHWGGKTGRKLFDLPLEARNAAQSGQEEDERRLFYVSMTRAKSRIYITHSLSRSDGKLLAPSRFIEDIDKKFISESREIADPKALMRPVVAREHLNLRSLSAPTVKYLQKLLLEQGMTVTALNNYLECPWQYFFRNLVRLPSAPERHQDFGSAIHDALRIFQNEVKFGKKPKESRLLALFSLNLRKFGFPDDEMAVWEKRGKEALSAFFDGHDWSQIVESELEIGGIEFPFSDDKKVGLRGKIDSVVFNGDSARVTDFKTGKPKSRNEILGKTKSSSGGIFRQLVFYKLLLEKMKKSLEVTGGTIEFVEPDKSGKCRREDFLLSAEDRKVLEGELVGAVTEIYNLSFWGKTCGERDCEYCRLRKSLELGA